MRWIRRTLWAVREVLGNVKVKIGAASLLLALVTLLRFVPRTLGLLCLQLFLARELERLSRGQSETRDGCKVRVGVDVEENASCLCINCIFLQGRRCYPPGLLTNISVDQWHWRGQASIHLLGRMCPSFPRKDFLWSELLCIGLANQVKNAELRTGAPSPFIGSDWGRSPSQNVSH